MRRRILLVIAGILFVLVAALYIRDLLTPPKISPQVNVDVVAIKRDYDTYTPIRAEDLYTTVVSATQASGCFRDTDLDDLQEKARKYVMLTTRRLFAGEKLSKTDLVQLGESWRPGSKETEVTSFYVATDKGMGGKLKPGHKINIYGYRPEQGNRPAQTVLIATNVWVVAVHSAGGEEVVGPTPEPGTEEKKEGGGLLSAGMVEIKRSMPANVVTVAADHETILNIISVLSNNFSAWVTLAPLEGGNRLRWGQ